MWDRMRAVLLLEAVLQCCSDGAVPGGIDVQPILSVCVQERSALPHAPPQVAPCLRLRGAGRQRASPGPGDEGSRASTPSTTGYDSDVGDGAEVSSAASASGVELSAPPETQPDSDAAALETGHSTARAGTARESRRGQGRRTGSGEAGVDRQAEIRRKLQRFNEKYGVASIDRGMGWPPTRARSTSSPQRDSQVRRGSARLHAHFAARVHPQVDQAANDMFAGSGVAGDAAEGARGAGAAGADDGPRRRREKAAREAPGARGT